MSALVDPEFWARLLSIILIDLSLAGDNALVIALAVRSLPPRQQLLGRIWGTAAAVGLRLAVHRPRQRSAGDPAAPARGRPPAALDRGQAGASRTRGEEGARAPRDLAARGDLDHRRRRRHDEPRQRPGRGRRGPRRHASSCCSASRLSLPIVVWGSGILPRLMTRHAWIIWFGGGILGYVAGEMITDDPVFRGWLGRVRATWWTTRHRSGRGGGGTGLVVRAQFRRAAADSRARA